MDIDKQKAIASCRSVDNLRLLIMSSLEGASETSRLLYEQLIATEMNKIGVQPRDFFQTIINILAKIRDSFPTSDESDNRFWQRSVETQFPEQRNDLKKNVIDRNSACSLPNRINSSRSNQNCVIFEQNISFPMAQGVIDRNSTCSLPNRINSSRSTKNCENISLFQSTLDQNKRILGEIQNEANKPRTSSRLAIKKERRSLQNDLDEEFTDNPNFTMRRIRPIEQLLKKVKMERITPKIKRNRGRQLKEKKIRTDSSALKDGKPKKQSREFKLFPQQIKQEMESPIRSLF